MDKPTVKNQGSPKAANFMMDQLGANGFEHLDDETQGATDCPEDCYVEADGVCEHGFLSAARTLGVI